MLRLRDWNKHDLAKIKNLNEQQNFRLLNLDNCVIDKVVECDNKIIAYGIVKEMSEAIILLDLNEPKITRVKALKELMKAAIFGASKKGHRQLHVFVSDRQLAESLKKHYGFIESQDIVLVRNL